MNIKEKLKIGGAFTVGALGSVFEVQRNVPDLTTEEAERLDGLIEDHDRVGIEGKAKPFNSREREKVLELWNFKSALSGTPDRKIGGKFGLHVHHARARAFGGESTIENAIPLTRNEHCLQHIGMQEAYLNYRRGEKDSFGLYTKTRGGLKKEPEYDKAKRLYIQGRIDQRIQDVRNFKKEKVKKLLGR